jgi:hypothetical protein
MGLLDRKVALILAPVPGLRGPPPASLPLKAPGW